MRYVTPVNTAVIRRNCEYLNNKQDDGVLPSPVQRMPRSAAGDIPAPPGYRWPKPNTIPACR